MPVVISGTNGITNATWTTATRPSAPSTGQMGYNTTTVQIEFYNGTSWQGSNVAASYSSSYLVVAGGGGGGAAEGGGGGAVDCYQAQQI